MSAQPTREHAPAAVVPVIDDPVSGAYVYLCGRCGQPLGGPRDLCHSALHVGTDGLGIGRAIPSTELARQAKATRAALSCR